MRYAIIFMTGLGVLFCAFPSLFMEIFSNGNMTLIDTGIPVLRTMLLGILQRSFGAGAAPHRPPAA